MRCKKTFGFFIPAVFSVRECYVTSSLRTKYEMRSFSFFIFCAGERKEKNRVI